MQLCSISLRFHNLHSKRTHDHRECERTRNAGLARWLGRRTLEQFRALSKDCSSYRPRTRSQARKGTFQVQNCSSEQARVASSSTIDTLNSTRILRVCKAQSLSSSRRRSLPLDTLLARRGTLQSAPGPSLFPSAYSSASYTGPLPLCIRTHSRV